jgi:[ribosomal protein S5]-alanine N-acetyltransferase
MNINFEIEFSIYQIRSFKPSDKNSLVKYANNYNISKNLRDRFPHPYTEADAEEWLGTVCNQKLNLSMLLQMKKN